MKSLILLISGLFCLALKELTAANAMNGEEGLRFITNYSRKDYAQASSQNWSVIQDRRGILYFANTEAVLEYDGSQWGNILLSNRSAVRSIAVDSAGKVYVGGQNEFGYLEPDSVGAMQYRSLLNRFPKEYRNFEDVHRTFIIGERIYIQTNKYFFLMRPDTILVWKPVNSFYRAQRSGERIYVQDYGAGLMMAQEDQFILLPKTEMFQKERLYGVFQVNPDRLLLFTRAGCFIYDGNSVRKHVFPADDYLKNQQIYAFTQTPDGDFVFSTTRGGILITDTAGHIRRVFDQSSGLMDDNVRFAYFDREGNLWACLNNGISKINYYYPITYFNEMLGLKGSVQHITRYRNRLFTATSQGVFYLDPAELMKGNFYPRFKRLSGIESQSWVIFTPDNNLLLAGTNDGVVQIENSHTKLLTKGITFTFFYSQRYQCIFVGFQKGVGYFEYRNRKLGAFRRIPEVDEEIRAITEDADGHIWLGTRLQYLLRLEFPQGLNFPARISRYNESHGLLSSRIFTAYVDNQIVFLSNKATYRFDLSNNRFIVDTNILSGSTFRTVYAIKESRDQKIWMISHENKLSSGIGYFQKSRDGSRIWYYKPFLRLPADPYYCIYLDNDGTAWMGGPGGIIRYAEHGITKRYDAPFSTILRKVILLPDSVIYLGSSSSAEKGRVLLPYRYNSIRFRFSATSYDYESTTQYQTLLEGFDEDWSAWRPDQVKEYTNLPEGEYRFRVRARNVYEYYGDEAVYAFTVLPPWYRTWWAFLIYGILIIGAVAGIVRWRLVYLEHEKAALEQIIEQRTSEIINKKSQLETIDRIVQSINAKYHVDEFLGSLIDEIGAIENSSYVAALLYDQTKNEFCFVSAKGWDLKDLQTCMIQPTDAVEWLSRDEDNMAPEVYLITNPQDRFGKTIPPLADLNSILVLRLEDPYQISGYLLFGRTNLEPVFRTEDITLLANLRQHIFSGFMKAQLLTHLESMNEELKRLNNQKNEFLGIAAHDLRNPLGAIIGYLDLLLMDMKKNNLNLREATSDIEMVLNSARQMVNIITELLDISAIESGKINLELQRANLNQIFEECERIHKKAAAQKRIRLVIQRNEKLPEVLIDKARIAEVVDNLLSNAIKYTYPDGEVQLYTEVLPKEIYVHVRDTGQGLSEHDLQHVFRTFKKLSARPTAGETSTGFGLAIVKKIVEMHHGRVWVESKVNQGSVFSFSLPLNR